MTAEPTAIVPDKAIRGCLNTETGIIAKGTLVALTTGATDAPLSVATAGAGVLTYGVAMEDIPGTTTLTGDPGPHWGNVQIEGKAIVLAGAAVARGAAVASNASGRAITAVSTNITAGQGIIPAAADGDFFEVELAGPGGGVVTP